MNEQVESRKELSESPVESNEEVNEQVESNREVSELQVQCTECTQKSIPSILYRTLYCLLKYVVQF